MTIFYDYIQAPPAPSIDSRQFSRRAKLPIFRNCPTLPPPFIINEADGYNCNLCGSDNPFYIPYEAGDALGFRLNLPDEYNDDPAALVAGWHDAAAVDWYIKAELIDADGGAVVSDFIDTFSDSYSVAYSDAVGSVQDFTINTVLFPVGLTCFKIRLTYRSATAPDTVVYTEPFKQVTADDCAATVQICGGPSKCGTAPGGTFENYLGTDNAAPVLCYRVLGAAEFVGCEIEETETDRGVVIRRKETKNYELTGGVVAPYFAGLICNLIAAGATIDGKKYVNFGGISKDNDAGSSFVLVLTFSEVCENNLFSCD